MSMDNQTQSTAYSAHWAPQILNTNTEMRLRVITTLEGFFSHTAAILSEFAPSVGTGSPEDKPYLIF